MDRGHSGSRPVLFVCEPEPGSTRRSTRRMPTPPSRYRSSAERFQAEKPLARAVLYACGLGQAEFRLNGRKIGDDLLQPGWTNYRKSCLYQTYDVTGMIRRGPNALGVLLGNGMYNVTGGRTPSSRARSDRRSSIAQLEIDYADGSRDLVVTDARWKHGPRADHLFLHLRGRGLRRPARAARLGRAAASTNPPGPPPWSRRARRAAGRRFGGAPPIRA